MIPKPRTVRSTVADATTTDRLRDGSPVLGHQVSEAVFWNSVMFPISMVLGALTSVWVVRYLGAQQFAVYVLLTSVINTVTRYSSFGLPRSIARFLPELRRLDDGPRKIRSLLRLSVLVRLGLTMLGISVLYLFTARTGSFLGLERSGLFLAIVSTGVVLVGLHEIGTYLLHGLFRQRDVNVINLIVGVLQPSLLILFILLGFGITGILLALVASSGLACVLSWTAGLRSLAALDAGARSTGGLFGGMSDLAGRVARYAGVVYVLDASKYLRALPFASLMLLGFFPGGRDAALGEVALLGVGFKLVDLAINFLVAATRGIYTPMLAEVHASRDSDKLRRVFRSASKLQILLCVPAAFGLFVLSRDFISVLFGEAFEAAVLLTRVLIVLLFVNTLIAIPSSVLLTWEKYRYIILSAVVSLLGIPAFVVAVRLGGAAGAALVLGLVGSLSRVAENWGAVREFGFEYPFAFLARVTVASLAFTAVVGATAAAIDVTPIRLFGLVLTGVVLFVGVFRSMGGLDPEERRIIESSSVPLKGLVLRIV